MAGGRLRTCVAVVLLVAACGGTEATRPPAAVTTTTAPTTAAPTTAAPTTTPPPAPAFTTSVQVVTAADLPSTWREGCPVAPDALRLVALTYWGFDDHAHAGTMVVSASVVDDVVTVFRTLFEQRFPIRLMQPVDAYGGSDDASIAADNTAGFNCRKAVANPPTSWSQHAFGLAIDVNPLENPAVLNGAVLPPAGAPFLDRTDVRPGMVLDGGPVVAAFASVGWGWGGRWSDVDYQHFSANGR